FTSDSIPGRLFGFTPRIFARTGLRRQHAVHHVTRYGDLRGYADADGFRGDRLDALLQARFSEYGLRAVSVLGADFELLESRCRIDQIRRRDIGEASNGGLAGPGSAVALRIMLAPDCNTRHRPSTITVQPFVPALPWTRHRISSPFARLVSMSCRGERACYALVDCFSLGVPGQIADRAHQCSLQRPVRLKRPNREHVDGSRAVVAVPDSPAVRRTFEVNQPLPDFSLQRKRAMEPFEGSCQPRAVLSQRQRHDVALGGEGPFTAHRSHV